MTLRAWRIISLCLLELDQKLVRKEDIPQEDDVEEDIPQEEMVENIFSMTESLKGAISQPLLQQLQLARQLESLSKSLDEHILNTAKWLVDDEIVLLRMSTWREIVRVGWIVHHYPVRGNNISHLPKFEETCFLTPWTVLKQALLPWNYDKLA